MQARAIKGLFLGPTKNAQGGFKIYNLETKSVITRKYVGQFNDRMVKTEKIVYGSQHVVTYSLQKGIKKFGQKG